MKKYYSAIMTAVIFWGASYLVTALAYETTGPVQLGLIRSVLAAALFIVYRAVTGVHEHPRKKDLPLFAVSGLFGVTLYFAFQNLGLAMTSSSNAALIVASYPAIVLVIDCLVHRVLPTVRQIVGIAVAVAGVGILTGSGGGAGSNPLLGNVLLIGAGVAWGIYSQASLKISQNYALSTLTVWQMIWGSLFLLPFVAAEGHAWVAPTAVSGASILFLAVCCSLVSFLCYNFALKGLPVASATSLLNLMPVVGIICSYVVLGESVTWQQIAGGAVVVAGVMLSSAGGAKAR